MKNYIFFALCFGLFLISCGGEDSSTKTPISTVNFGGKDLLWNDCIFLSEQELTTLDTLRNKLNQNNTAAQDKPVFEEYMSILLLADKSEQELLNCKPSTPENRERVMKHFVFLGLRYGRGEFSFVDNPRVASYFEREQVFNYPKKGTVKKMLNPSLYSKSDEVGARFILGGTIVMQASLKMASKDFSSIIAEIADAFNILKYGRVSIFNRILYTHRQELKSLVAGFLAHDQSFLKAFSAMRDTKAGVYPMMLKKDLPYYPKDASEVIAAKTKYVVGIGTSAGGTTPLGTGFFAQLSGQALFLTSGHWQYNRQLFARYQISADPFGSTQTTFAWNNERLDVFNFSEQLFVPILKALDFSDDQIANLRNKFGTNPFGKSFFKFTWVLPWADTAIALPHLSHLDQTGLAKDLLPKLSVHSDDGKTYFAVVEGFGLTEDLEHYGKDKSPGFRRFSAGGLSFNSFTEFGFQSRRLILYTPITLKQFDSVFQANTMATYSMRFGPRCSGSPITVGKNIVGLLQGPMADKNDDEYLGIRTVHFTNQFLALITELITDDRGLHGIPEADLIALVRKTMFNDITERKKMHQELLRVAGL